MSNLSASLGKMNLGNTHPQSTDFLCIRNKPALVAGHGDSVLLRRMVPEHLLAQVVNFHIENDAHNTIPSNKIIKVSLVEADKSVLKTKMPNDAILVAEAIFYYTELVQSLKDLFFERKLKSLAAPKYESLKIELVDQKEYDKEFFKEEFKEFGEIKKRYGCALICNPQNLKFGEFNLVLEEDDFHMNQPDDVDEGLVDETQMVEQAVLKEVHHLWHFMPNDQKAGAVIKFRTIPVEPFKMYKKIIPPKFLLKFCSISSKIKKSGQRTVAVEWYENEEAAGPSKM